MQPAQENDVRAQAGDAIWKFELRPWAVEVLVPMGAKVLSVGAQGDSVVAWALCDTEAPEVPRFLSATPTGTVLPRAYEGARFVGTVQMDNGLVFHVFDGGER